MRLSLYFGLTVMMVGFTGVPVVAQQASRTINLGTTKILVPFPTGFCAPATEQEKAAEQLIAAADSDNITHLTLTECGKPTGYEGKAEYLMLKTPRQALMAHIDRNAVQKEFAQVIATNAVDTSKSLENANRDLNKTLSVEMDITGDIQLRGQDDVCTYMTGAVDVASAQLGSAYKVAFAGCITTVDKKLISVNWYSYEVTPASIEKMKAKAKALIIAMSGDRPQ